MTAGLLGGSFDPPHNGHLALADEALRRFALDRLVVVVTGVPPHKAIGTDATTRFRLAEAAFADRPSIELSRHEIDREGTSYTVDTVRWARSRWEDVIFVVGADEFADFLSWRDPNGVLAQARLGVATRPGYPAERLRAVLAQLEQPERVEFFEIPAFDVSSTEVRGLVSRGEPFEQLVPSRVAELIERLGLYRS
jgi:nicotinate-nucleotide adenylyltransferase